MKKITLNLLALLVTVSFWQVNAQEVLNEDFNAGVLPAGWSLETDGTPGYDAPGACGAALFSFECVNGNTFSAPANPNWSGTIAAINDDDAGGGFVGTGHIISSSVDLSANGGDGLTFDYSVDNSGGYFTVDGWNGASWDNLLTETTDFIDSPTLNISAFNNADFSVRFSYNDGGNWAWGVGIDNVVVTEAVPAGPSSSSTICSTQVPLEFSPPLYGSVSVLATSSTNSGDLGIIGTGDGEYQISSVVINVQSDTANQTAYALQGPDGQVIVLGEFGGGTDGLDTAADLVFTDSSVNNYYDWNGGSPAANYQAEDGLMNAILAGADMNGEWFLVVYGDGASSTVNSFCINLVYQTGPFPMITCPADMTVTNTVDLCSAVVNYSLPTGTGGTITIDDPTQATGSSFAVGDHVVSYTSTNIYGGMTSCSFNITVEDVQLPVAIANVGITVTLDANGEAYLNPSDMLSGSTDNCEVELYDTSNGGLFTCADIGTVTLEGAVWDTSLNMSVIIEFDVLVIDDMAPVITCLGAPGTQTYSQNFNAVPVGSTPPAGWSNDIVVRDWDWKFGSGVMPNSPSFTTPAAIFDDDAAGPGEVNEATLTSPSYDLSAASIESASFSYEYALDELGAETLIVSAWDGSAWAQIALYDTDVDPTNSGPMDVTSMLNADFKMRFTYNDGGIWGWGAGIDNVDLTVVSAQAAPHQVILDDQGFSLVSAASLIGNVVDNCGTWTAASAVAGDCDQTNPNDGTFENGYNCSSATDFRAANDIIVEAEGVFVVDHITASIFSAATIASVDVIYHDDDAGLPGNELFNHTMAPTSQAIIGENFGLNVNEIQLSVPEYTFYGGQGESIRYWIELKVTASDGGGGVYWVVTSSSSIGEPLALFNGGWGIPDPAMDGVMSVKGTCEGASGFAFDCSTLGIQEVVVYVTDAGGNTSSCTATVEVIDNIAPVITCGPGDGLTTVTEDFESTTGSTPPAGWSNDIVVGAWDWKFGSGTMPNSDDFPSKAAIFDDDAAGNGETNAATLTSPSHDLTGAQSAHFSYDYTLDELGAGETLIVSAWDGSAWAQIALYDADVIPPTNSGPMDVSSLMNADFKMRFTFDDAGSWGWGAGIDNVDLTYANPPVTSDVVVVLGEDGTATLAAGDYLSEQYDACGIDVLTADRYTYSCEDLLVGPITVTVTAVDGSGNASVCQATVVVVDTMAPSFTCPDDQSMPVDSNGAHILANYWDSIVVTDNCTDAVILLTQDPAPGTQLGVGTYNIVLTATDDYGNVTTCNFTLDLTILGTQDNELNNAISLYPNPANEQVTISNSSNIALETAMIYDLNGKLVSQINLQNMQSEKVIDVATFATGVYMVYITGEQSSVVKRLIKE